MRPYGAKVNLLPHLPLWTELLIFLASAGVIWVAGIPLSDYTDILADRLHLGQALGGLILLAVATNLPEIAITYSAAASGHLDIAVEQHPRRHRDPDRGPRRARRVRRRANVDP